MAVTNYVLAAEVAKRLGVVPQTIRRWIKEGRLFATYTKGEYRIPDIDAELFCQAYEKEFGTRLGPKPYMKRQKHRVAQTPRPAPTGKQSFYVTLDGAILGRIDKERRQAEDRVTRSDFVEAAVGYYLNYLKYERRRRSAS